jgi:hypothetical protein
MGDDDFGWNSDAIAEFNNYMTSQGYEEIPSWMGGNRDMETGDWYSGLNEANSGTNFESMNGWTYKDGIWTDRGGQTYDTRTGTGSLADAMKSGGIGAMLGMAGAAGLAQQLLGGGGNSGYAGYQGGIPKYTAQRTQYALPITPLPAAQQAKVSDASIKNFMSQEGLGADRVARAMYKYGITPERMAGITSLPVADVAKTYREALGPNQSLANPIYGQPGRRPGSGGITYFSPMQYTPVPPPVVPADTTKTDTTAGSTTVVKAGGGRIMTDGIASLGGYSDGGQLLRGPGDGVSDDIPATIGRKQPARLADGEFVVPARIVSELGNGSTEAGARKLYAMMDRIKKTRSKAKNIAANTKADKHLPA